MHQNCQSQTDERSNDFDEHISRLSSKAKTHACHACKQWMRERSKHSAKYEHQRQSTSAALQQRFTVVLDILCHRKSKADHACVDDAIEHAIKLIFTEEKVDQQNGGFGAL